MDILLYNELDPRGIAGFDKLYQALSTDDFKTAEVKKIQPNLYRAKLNRSDRMLFAIYQHQQKKYILLLEYLKNHDYQGSRFLNAGIHIDEQVIHTVDEVIDVASEQQMVYLNPQHPQLVYLNKFISFDDVQREIYQRALPLVIIGSAGSGKTAILLEKIKKLEGRVLYATLSSFLVKNSRELYFSHDYYNPEQQVDFYSFDEFLESIEVPSAQPANFSIFSLWYRDYPQRTYPVHSLYEEFRGVLTGASTQQAYLSLAQYLALGVKQSIFTTEDKPQVYAIFQQYLSYLAEAGYYEANLLSFDYLEKSPKIYDYVVVDEVQDITAIQLYLLLTSLKQPYGFLLCGDANQIVHPNFFSWAKIKTLFYSHEQLHQGREITHILQHNYRNSQRVTELSNRILLLKHARFGSIDKESHYLVQTNADLAGGVFFLQNQPNILQELDQKTAISTQFAVVVMHEDQKKMAQRVFKTPLVFSIQEAKGLEYNNIILYNFVSTATAHFNEICRDIQLADLQQNFSYARNKDKNDKSLEVYKFYINALYVGLTRAMQNVYWVEQENQHQIFKLLGLEQALQSLDLAQQQSSLKEWQKEAKRLELQGKTEQAERIRKEILKEQRPTWTVYRDSELKRLAHQALSEGNKKAKLQLFEYAVVYQHQRYLSGLAQSGFKPAQQIFADALQLDTAKAEHALIAKYYTDYTLKHPTALMKKIEKFGLNFHNEFAQTPILAAIWMGKSEIFRLLLDEGADLQQHDGLKHNALQIALAKAVSSPKYAKGFFAEHYSALPMDSVVLQHDQKLFKLEAQQAEYLIFQILYVMCYSQSFQRGVATGKWINTAQLIQYLAHLPEHIVPAHRKKREYLTALLSKNEVDSSDKYGKKLFKRIRRGEYILNPDLAIKLQGEWQALYVALDYERIDFYPVQALSTPPLKSHKSTEMLNRAQRRHSGEFFAWIAHPQTQQDDLPD